MQEDETALVLWALWRHFYRYRDIEFIKPHYRGLIIRAANWLASYRHPETGLPLPSWDLWEERRGVFAWTAGAVWGGLIAAANFVEAFGEASLAEHYRRAADEIKQAVAEHLWHEPSGRFVRMIDGNEDDEQAIQPGDVGTADLTLDASLMGLWYFGMFAADDERIVKTMHAVRDALMVRTAGWWPSAL